MLWSKNRIKFLLIQTAFPDFVWIKIEPFDLRCKGLYCIYELLFMIIRIMFMKQLLYKYLLKNK